MDYNEVLKYMYACLPMYHRIGPAALKPGLENTIALCAKVGNPQQHFKSIHVAGTNGKGSSSHMLAAIFQQAGYKTGLYTSPHLKNFTERIKINGKEIDTAYVTDFVNKYKQYFDTIQPSFFEMTVALAFKYFEDSKVDIAIIEVGLGGRLDSTNIIMPEACLITNISMDHQAILGNTLAKIASEKAGIIKDKTSVIISEKQAAIVEVFSQKAKQHGAPLLFASDEYGICSIDNQSINPQYNILLHGQILLEDVKPALHGDYQQPNILGVVAMSKLMQSYGWNIADNDIKRGIENTIALTNLKGRWQTINESPKTIVDVGHNEGGIRYIVKQIANLKYKDVKWVFGVVDDKDITTILALLPQNVHFYFCQAQSPRAMNSENLFELAKKNGLKGSCFSTVSEAFQAANIDANSQSLIIVGGSTFVVAEVL